MARTLIKKSQFIFAHQDDVNDNDVDTDDDGRGGFRVLACTDTLARTPLGVRQYFIYKLFILETGGFKAIILRLKTKDKVKVILLLHIKNGNIEIFFIVLLLLNRISS